MGEHLNDEELALELTKVFVEHMNRNVDRDRPKTMMSARGVASYYQLMLEAVQNPALYLKKGNDRE